MKFTETGNINFGYTPEESELHFYVSDTGKGIPEDKYHQIFDRFYQVEHSESRLYEGTGLGLSICKAYVELLGGHIWLNSSVGEGTTFYFSLPLKGLKISHANKESLNTGDHAILKKDIIILITEDDDNNYRLLCEILQPLGYIIIRATDGIEAITKCQEQKNIDLVFMDVKMPGMDGYEATRQIRSFLPDLPIIVQTAFVKDREKAFEYGCNDFISKPFTKQEILSVISNNIKQQ